MKNIKFVSIILLSVILLPILYKVNNLNTNLKNEHTYIKNNDIYENNKNHGLLYCDSNLIVYNGVDDKEGKIIKPTFTKTYNSELYNLGDFDIVINHNKGIYELFPSKNSDFSYTFNNVSDLLKKSLSYLK